LRATRLDVAPTLKSTTLRAAGKLRSGAIPVGKILVAGQVTVSLILLVAAGLFVRSLSKLAEVNLGYQQENLLLFEVNAAAGGYKDEAATRLYRELLEKVAAIPGVQKATVSHNGLFSDTESGDPLRVEGYTPKPGEEADSRIDHVGPRYFSTIGIPILMGRGIEEQDSSGLRGAVINETFARKYFPNTNPLGKHVSDIYPGNPADAVVVGVAADAKYNSLREKSLPRLYAPLFEPMWPQRTAIYEVRSFANSASLSAAFREAVRTTSASLPPIEIKTMSGLVDDSLQTDRFIKQLSGAFGLLAIVLASIGLYGIMAYTVACKTREIGIRLALGAEPKSVLWRVLRETLALVLIGIGIGVPLAVGGSRLIRSMLFGLGFADPAAILFAAALMIGVALLAGVLPARKAMRVDPMVALRYE
jgi:predicted permease